MVGRWRIAGLTLSRCMVVYGRRSNLNQIRRMPPQSLTNELMGYQRLIYTSTTLHREKQSDGDKSSSDSSDSDSDGEIDDRLTDAAKAVAEVLAGDRKSTENELIGQLKSEAKLTASQKAASKQISSLLANLKVQKPAAKPNSQPDRKKKVEGVRGRPAKIHQQGQKVDTQQMHQRRESDAQDQRRQQKAAEQEQPRRAELKSQERDKRRSEITSGLTQKQDRRVGLSGQDEMVYSLNTDLRLNIFDKAVQETDLHEDLPKSLWDIVAEEELHRTQFGKIHNDFQEQMRLTREGKLWTFPIDNDQGWTEEEDVGFHEHVLLERQLKDFPRTGPIRHFMDLVTTALSKNPYLTVQQKHEHIDWFRNYFIEKQKVYHDVIQPQDMMQMTKS